MRALLLPFEPRFIIYTASIVLTVLLIVLALGQSQLVPYLSVFIALFGGLSALGTLDLLQTRHSVLRNYPITAHLRFLLETIRPEMRQYFFEDENTGCHSIATSAPSSISAPRKSSTSGRSGLSTTSMPRAMSGCATRLRHGRPRSSRFGS
jgi:hypothetical protein